MRITPLICSYVMPLYPTPNLCVCGGVVVCVYFFALSICMSVSYILVLVGAGISNNWPCLVRDL